MPPDFNHPVSKCPADKNANPDKKYKHSPSKISGWDHG